MLHKIRPYSAFVVCSLLVAAVSVAAQLYIPILCGDAIDKMLGKGNVDLAGVLRIAVSILVVAAVAALAQWLLSVCNNRITFSVSRDLRNEALRKFRPCRCPIWTATPPAISSAAWWRMWTPLRTAC